ncbi:hypothetical protein SeMB42_g05638 [Synchytrium endobioticum]|uniref:Transcription factor CBF/NF-Y/archaeal histone domain-containing protein n=1 Tax=Synchytrium endobioticum TaxID=286115 RepID=A0A507D575_9FUNG|nr:hypothetical protein SeMB42_g05638 [Synchytrium endobioticum]TPX46481.1 hypothetical protein SeLEV6574_g03221 [Synchytrium endobioticum]
MLVAYRHITASATNSSHSEHCQLESLEHCRNTRFIFKDQHLHHSSVAASSMGDASRGDDADTGSHDSFREHDRFLPIANVARIMKRALPESAKIAKDAKECVQECVSEFISFIASEAAEKCQEEKRKTINGDDVLRAMQSLGFENYRETLQIYLHKYRETVKLEKAATASSTPQLLSGIPMPGGDEVAYYYPEPSP